MTYQVMRPKGWMGLLGFMAIAVLMCLTGCSSDDGDDPRGEGPDFERSVPLEVVGYVADYQDVQENRKATRAWLPPSGFTRYDETGDVVSICFTQNNKDPENEKMIGYFFNSNGQWRTDLEDIKAETYYLYGYTPHTSGVTLEISSSSSLDDHSSYSEGAVLRINNLPTVTSSDVCVVVGAKNGTVPPEGNYTVEGLRRGSFEYEAKATSPSGATGNYVFLLFDHIYASMRFRMKVESTYHELRTIKLKEMKLKTSSDNSATKKKMNATVTLTKTSNSSFDPIANIVFNPIEGLNEEVDGSVVQSGEGITLTPTAQDFQSYFMPQGVTTFIVTSIYDVYDKKGNCVRENCSAVNTLSIRELFSQQTQLFRGNRYTVNMTIKPTYLYKLSEPDLDNPTLELGIGN